MDMLLKQICLGNIPNGIYVLLGISGGSYVVAKGIHENKKRKRHHLEEEVVVVVVEQVNKHKLRFHV